MTHQICQLRRPRQGSGNSRPSSSDRTLCSRHYLLLVLESCQANPVQTHANGTVQALCKFALTYYLLCAHQPKHQQHYMLHLANSNTTSRDVNEMLRSEIDTSKSETSPRPSKIFLRPRPRRFSRPYIQVRLKATTRCGKSSESVQFAITKPCMRMRHRPSA